MKGKEMKRKIEENEIEVLAKRAEDAIYEIAWEVGVLFDATREMQTVMQFATDNLKAKRAERIEAILKLIRDAHGDICAITVSSVK